MKDRLAMFLGVFALAVSVSTGFSQGSLTPPGPPAPGMRTLLQIEPRTPISSLPFNITNSGSYYLTTNLTGVSGTNGITVTANSVTLDLGGFTLTGVSGALNGISVPGLTQWYNFTLKNGSITGWPENGVDADVTHDSHFTPCAKSNCYPEG